MKDYGREAEDDAKETVRHFIDEIVEQLLEKGEASDDLLNDYSGGDSYHHESHTDKAYNLTEAASILDQLGDDYEETDSGLWEGLPPREAISCQAAFTYANAVYGEWRKLIETINDSCDIAELLLEYNNTEDDVAGLGDAELENRQDDIKTRIEEAIREVI